jgi:acetyl-CoA acetyltransferase
LSLHTSITGVGFGPIGREVELSEGQLAVVAARAAIADAGLEPDAIDGLSMFPTRTSPPVGFTGPPLPFIQRALGLHRLRYIQSFGVESAQFGPILAAAYATSLGVADHILVIRAHKKQIGRYLPTTLPGRRDAWDEEAFTIPYGVGGGAARAALAATRHMFEFGTTQEQLGAVCVTFREHAQLNPRAVWNGTPLTLEQYMNSRWVSAPFKLFDCDYPIDGAVAIVVSNGTAARRTRKPIRVESVGQAPGPDTERLHRESYIDNAGHWASQEMWSRTTATASDLDIAEVYDGFSMQAIVWLENLGVVAMGQGGPFFEQGRGSLGSDGVKVCTDGGQLGGGRLHGFGKLAQAVAQLREEAGPMQVRDAELGVACSGGGAVASTVLLSNSAQRSE